MDPLSPDAADKPMEGQGPAPHPPAPDGESPPPGTSGSDDLLLTVMGHVVAYLILALGVVTTAACFYVVYRVIVWLWFTP